jgi:general nucleoside transport system permease protein
VRAFQGSILFFVLACDTLIHYRVRLVRPAQKAEAAHV